MRRVSLVFIYTKHIRLRVKGSLVYKNGEPVETDENNFVHGSEVTFNCVESILGEKTTWKIICENGSWIGVSLNCGKSILISVLNKQTIVGLEIEVMEKCQVKFIFIILFR